MKESWCCWNNKPVHSWWRHGVQRMRSGPRAAIVNPMLSSLSAFHDRIIFTTHEICEETSFSSTLYDAFAHRVDSSVGNKSIKINKSTQILRKRGRIVLNKDTANISKTCSLTTHDETKPATNKQVTSISTYRLMNCWFLLNTFHQMSFIVCFWLLF